MHNEPFILLNKQFLSYNGWNDFSTKIVTGFTTKNGGNSIDGYETFNLGLHVNDDPNKVSSNRLKLSSLLEFPTSRWACTEQTHENNIIKISSEHCGLGAFNYNESIKGTDGLYTNDSNVLLTLCFADCVPLYFFSPSHHYVGIAHAGWKGSVKDIAGEMVRKWNDEGIDSKDIYTLIGPSIGSCCYVVDDFVIDYVKGLDINEGLESPIYKAINHGEYRLDLKRLNEQLLHKAGIPYKNIRSTSYCTSCEEGLFFSHRRDKGNTGRMMSFIGLKEEDSYI
ncbi:peptidoglycan editing factor PgeF [Fredinandcohnia quinoae]|uniref:Purine nucleoside phosphorylase n=1 Tax=Fredinandcohnia quinoae TaxID=2918902 RepID=A0AAW5E171_9BACI|nr:peptidoglycan editing factor PgeF [Fredinandcohnia sp. SECRCQ15]MCH1623862.1 peptidoglycan editing factor PgeF [Fredinandcohnia sp. SECRCQ15]